MSLLILSVDIVDDPSLILLSIVECIERESEELRNSLSLFEIHSRRTSRILLVEIVDHIPTRYLMPLLFEEKSRNSRVNTS